MQIITFTAMKICCILHGHVFVKTLDYTDTLNTRDCYWICCFSLPYFIHLNANGPLMPRLSIFLKSNSHQNYDSGEIDCFITTITWFCLVTSLVIF